MKKTLLVAVIAFSAAMLAACSTAPVPITNGTYRSFAHAASINDVPAFTATVSNGSVQFSGEPPLAMNPGNEKFIVCPPREVGVPSPLSAPVTFGNVTFQRPALIGDCGGSKPIRITLVDLDSIDDSVVPFPFRRWIELCDTADPDCAS